MISVEYCELLARYNRWMNERLYALAAQMSNEERTQDRGAFFGSIHRTLDHILWADRAWLARFTSVPHPDPAYGADAHPDFAVLARERDETDTALLHWTGRLKPDWLASTLEYRAASDGRLRTLPAWIAATHLFQHATHHRGQVTTMLKQAGKDIGATDLQAMPGIVRMLE